MATKIVDQALDKLSKKYPNFSADSGKKVVDSLQDAYKSFQNKRKVNGEVKSVPENDALIEIPSDPGQPSPSESYKSIKRDSLYENCEEYDEKNPPFAEGASKKFPDEPKKSLPNGDSNGSYHQLSDKPSPSSSAAASDEGEKKELICPPPPPEAPVKPTEAPNMSQYLQKKSMAQGMMDLALLSANTNQLRYILDSRSENAYFSVSLTLIMSSLVLQIVVGMMLVWNSQYNVQRKSGFASADRINNLSVFGIFLITLINVFVSTFGNVPAAAAPSTSSTTAVPGSSTLGSGVETTSIAAVISSEASPVIEGGSLDPMD